MLKKSDKFRKMIRKTIVWPIQRAIRNLKQRLKNRKIYGIARRIDALEELVAKAERKRESDAKLPNINPPLTNGAAAILAENKGGEILTKKDINTDGLDPSWLVKLEKRKRQPVPQSEVDMNPKTLYK